MLQTSGLENGGVFSTVLENKGVFSILLESGGVFSRSWKAEVCSPPSWRISTSTNKNKDGAIRGYPAQVHQDLPP